jgi:hypothetical protein
MCPSISNKLEYRFCLISAYNFFINFVEQHEFHENQPRENHILLKGVNKFLAVHILIDLNEIQYVVEKSPTSKHFKIVEHFTIKNILEA